MSHGKRPAFQFYPKDWLSDPRLRACSPAARGLWADLMAIMHDCDPYGHLARDGAPMPDAAVARQVGESLTSYRRLLKEIEAHGVSSRTDVGILYSRRMVRDERVRRLRALGGSLSTENPNVPRPKNDTAEGYPPEPLSDHERMGVRIPSDPSPAVADASAVASAVTPSSAAAARTELLSRLAKEPGRHDVVAFIDALPKDQSEFAWLRILIGCLVGDGMPGMVPATTGALATGCREFLALVAPGRWSPRFLRSCVADAMRTSIARTTAPPKASHEQRTLAAAAEFVARKQGRR